MWQWMNWPGETSRRLLRIQCSLRALAEDDSQQSLLHRGERSLSES